MSNETPHIADSGTLRKDVAGVLAAHESRTQNLDGDWLCACGAFLCPPNDERLDGSHREHIATIVERTVLAERVRAAKADAWDERSNAKPQYLGPDDGHYGDDCMGWEDCHCASYPNPYRTPPAPTAPEEGR